MATFVFPGQGAQMKGMGGSLFDEFRDIAELADEVLGYSIKRLCLEDPDNLLGQTEYTQPSLFTVNALSYLKRVMVDGRNPDFVAGHSLGEYNALFAAGVFDFREGLLLVRKRGELMSRATGGGMAAIIGLKEDQVAEVLHAERLEQVDIANLNAPSQIVISGRKEDIARAKGVFEQTPGVAMVVELRTSGAFHSRFLLESQREFEKYADSFVFRNPSIPVISNLYARPYRESEIKQTLVRQITHPVRWTDSIRYLMGKGERTFEEIGPGKVLTGLIARIVKEAEPIDEEPDPASERSPDDGHGTGANERPEPAPEPIAGKAAAEPASPPAVPRGTAAARDESGITPQSLGDPEFKRDYGIDLAYLAGGMYRGIASKEMVARLGKAGLMGFLGTGGMELSAVEDAIRYIQAELPSGGAYGMNFIHQPSNPEKEERLIDLILARQIRIIEASAFLSMTPALVKYRAKGAERGADGRPIARNKLIAKVSRPEVAAAFLSPAPERIVASLLAKGSITSEEARLLERLPMADDLCVEADSAGHTDGGVAYALMPAMQLLRDEMQARYGYGKRVRVGAAGGIGTPEAAAAAFTLGADFIMTGSINQCTMEAGTSDRAKDLLQQMNVQDTEYAPAGDMFEIGARVQVLRKGVFFPARANKLFELYRMHDSLEAIDAKTRTHLEEKYFKRSFEAVYDEIKARSPVSDLEQAERNPKHKMALVFKWYFAYSSQLALAGDPSSQVDYQIHCGPALGAFNQWVRGTDLENWRNRHVDEIGHRLMTETARLLERRLNQMRVHMPVG